MNIVVLVKQVPDTWAERRLQESDKTLDRASVDVVMNEIDEYAVEEALRIKESVGSGEVTILTMGPERCTCPTPGWPAPTPCRPPTRWPRSSAPSSTTWC